jgi:hypothetical protein
LLDDAQTKTCRVPTCKLEADGSGTITRWEVPGPALARSLQEIGEQPRKVGEVLSIEVMDVETRDGDA